MNVDFDDGDDHVDANRKGGHASEEANQDEQTAKEFGEGREISAPGGKAEAGDELNMVVKSAEDFMVTVVDEDGAESKAHDEEREGLKAIEVAQRVPPTETIKITAAARVEGSRTKASDQIGNWIFNTAGENNCAGGELLITFLRPHVADCCGGLLRKLNCAFAGLRSILWV